MGWCVKVMGGCEMMRWLKSLQYPNELLNFMSKFATPILRYYWSIGWAKIDHKKIMYRIYAIKIEVKWVNMKQKYL